MIETKKKKPLIAFVLNLFLPGIGFAYIGTPFLIVGGIAFFAIAMISSFSVGQEAFKTSTLIFSLLSGLSLGIIGYGVCTLLNSLQISVGKKETISKTDNIYCSHCGAQNIKDSRFCEKCGKELSSKE